MKNFLCKFKFPIIFGGLIGAVISLTLFLYLWVMPHFAASAKVHNFIDKKLYEYTGMNLIIKDVRLETGINPYISFKTADLELVKNNTSILALKNIDTKISLSKLLSKKIIVKRLGADYIFADVNKIIDSIPKTEQKQETKFDWYFDFMDSIVYLKKLKVLYNANGINFDVNTDNISLNNDDNINYLHFDFNGTMKQGKNVVKIALKDENKVYIKNKQLFINNSKIKLNQSTLKLNAKAKDNKKYHFDVSAEKFDISNIVALIESNLVIPNGAEMLTYFDNINGNFDFKFSLTEKGIDGKIKLHKLYFIFIPIEKVPVHMYSGDILVDKKDIYLKNFSGYYGTRTVNSLKFVGKVKDYMKTFSTTITADGVVTDDFAKYYLSPVIGIPIGIVGKADTRVIIKYLNNVIDLKWLFKVSPEDNLLVSGEPISPYKEERVIVSNMNVIGTKLKIKDLNYYVTVPGVKEFYRRKLLSLHGLIDFAKGVDFRVMGFEIEQPVPSQFLNIIARQEIFKNGTASGKLTAVDGPKGVKLFGNLNLDKVLIPSQRLYINNANLSTNFDTLNIKADGGYRRSHFNVTGNLVNNIAFPIIVNDINFNLDSLDLEKLVNTFNQQGSGQTKNATKSDVTEDMPTFDLTNIVIKNCNLTLNKAVYKDLSAENMQATVKLDEKGELDLDSNKFDFAKGHSSAHVCCDLKNHKYHVKLGVKDVDSNLIATSLLNLPKEISGKASGIIDINTDNKLKLNGNIKFLVKDGTIGKIGLIEYILNVASVFRNPLAMISPLTVFDLINVPNGKFEKIQGTLNIVNNNIEDIKIKSFGQYLSAYVAGKYNLEKKDASLRVYTRFTNKKKGLYGVLRYLSLSNIASRVSIGARNDVNYYSSELSELPEIDASEKDSQIFLTRIDGDVESNNFISSLRKLK